MPGDHHYLTLKSGAQCLLRPVEPEDKHLFVEGAKRFSSDSLYWRFMSAKRRFSEAELKYLTEVDRINHVAYIALVNESGKEQGIGVSRWVRYKDRPDAADFALYVGDPYHRQGLGRAMLHRLIEEALAKGVHFLCGQMFAQHPTVFGLIDTCGYASDWALDGSVAFVEIDLHSPIDLAH